MYITLISAFKNKIKKNESVEVWYCRYGVATISNGYKVDYILMLDLKKSDEKAV